MEKQVSAGLFGLIFASLDAARQVFDVSSLKALQYLSTDFSTIRSVPPTPSALFEVFFSTTSKHAHVIDGLLRQS